MARSYGVDEKQWKPSIDDDPTAVDIESRLHTATEIDTRPANIEKLETYEERIGDYKARSFTYIPIPGEQKYYNTEEGWIKNLDSNQFIDEDTHLMEVLRRLQKEPFLLVDYNSTSVVLIHEGDEEPFLLYPEDHEDLSYSNHSNAMNIEELGDEENIGIHRSEEAKNEYPSLENLINKMFDQTIDYDEDRYGIITLADVNRRGVKIMIYVVLSALVSRLSHKIEKEYPNSENIFKHLRAETIGRWHKDRIEGLELHVAEHMNLIEIMQVVQASDSSFVEACGFESKEAVQDLGSINDIRNRVMHANRSLIYDRRDIQDIISKINRAQEIVSNME